MDQKDEMVSCYPTRLAKNAYVHNFTQGSSECAIVVVQEKHPGEVASLLVGLQAVTKVEHRSPSLYPDQNKIGSALSWESNNKRNYMWVTRLTRWLLLTAGAYHHVHVSFNR